MKVQAFIDIKVFVLRASTIIYTHHHPLWRIYTKPQTDTRARIHKYDLI